MTNTNTASGAEELATRLRNACASVRNKSYPLSDLIPLMQQAADALAPAASPVDQPDTAYAALPEAEYFIDNPSAWSSFDQRASDALAGVCKALRASRGQAPAQAAPAYKDSTPELHVGDSAFESWYSSYNPTHKGDKQRARDAYAAGMGDPLVMKAQADNQPAHQWDVGYPPLPEPLEIDWPELHSEALGCGVEDRNIHDRYEAAEYGWQDGVDRAADRVPEQIYDADQMRAYVDADRAARAPADSVTAPAGGAVAGPTLDVQAKIDSNTWDHFDDILPTLKAISRGDWYLGANSRCKYIEIRIDTRDGGCILYDRDRVRISPEQFAFQAGGGCGKMEPWAASNSLAAAPTPAAQAADSVTEDTALPQAARDVLAERQRQISAEGWTPEHDDEHVNDEIAAMACYYVMPPGAREWSGPDGYGATLGEAIRPEGWDAKDCDRRRELVKGAALALAELERIDRAAIAEHGIKGGQHGTE